MQHERVESTTALRFRRSESINFSTMKSALSVSVDRLEEILGNVKTWGKEHNVQVIQGWLGNKVGIPLVVFVDEDGDGSYERFLMMLERLGGKVLICDVTRLDQKALEDCMEKKQWAGDKDGSDLIQKYEANIGQIAMIEFIGLIESPRMLLDYPLPAEWHSVIYKVSERQNGFREDDPEIEGLARLVANSESFHRARNQDQREYIAKKVLTGQEKARNRDDLLEIVQVASAIYETELKPQLEVKLLRDIRTFGEQGLKADEIALKVGLPVRRVRSLIRGS